MNHFIGILGIILIIFLCWLMSEQKKAFPWRIVGIGLLLQIIIGILVLKIPFGIHLLRVCGNAVTAFLGLASKGSEMLFGNIVKPEFAQTFGFQFAFTVLPAIIFFSSVMSIMYHLGIMQHIVRGMSWCMSKTLHTSGIESLSASANIFLGQTEAPLLIKPYLGNASRSELNTIMVGGFITIAGGVMAGYIQMGVPAESLITASVMAAPAGLMLSKIVIPSLQVQHNQLPEPVLAHSYTLVEAAANGASDGIKLALGIAAMLIAFIALVAGVNSCMYWIHEVVFQYGINFPVDLKQLFGWLLSPIALILGVPPQDAQAFGSLIGTKISLNEFIAYADLSEMIKQQSLDPKTIRMASFALCGFANFSSIAIQIGGIGEMAPHRKKDIAQLGLKAMATGALGNLLTATLAGLLL